MSENQDDTIKASFETLVETKDGPIPVSVTLSYPDHQAASAVSLLVHLARDPSQLANQLLQENGPDRSLLAAMERDSPQVYERFRAQFEAALRAKDQGQL